MNSELIEAYRADDSHAGPVPEGAFTGAAGGAVCGDLVRLSVELDRGRIAGVAFETEGCAATRAAAAALADLADNESMLSAARLGPADVAAALGGLTPQGAHAADLVADALHRAIGSAVSSGVQLAPPPADRERVLVALSGGVDSAVAALLEREKKMDVVAVTLKLWADSHTDGARSCCSPQAVLGARGVAHSLGLPHVTLDLEEAFRSAVVQDFLDGYAAGRTPNPCVRCNGDLRIDAMIALADRLGASHLVTGHYARIRDDGEGPLLHAAADAAKDQTYMLSALAPESLSRLRFPLSELTKPEVRALAAEAGLPVATKRESQDLCFLAGEGKRAFLVRHGRVRERRGEVVDRRGRRLGEHGGHHNFTVGQRRGLGVGGPQPLYVLSTDAATNQVVVGEREDLARTSVRVRSATLHRPGARVDSVKLRYHSKALGCEVEDVDPGVYDELELSLAEPAYGVAPGQTACLMAGDLVVGQAIIA